MRTSKRPFSRETTEVGVEVDAFHFYVMGEPWRYALVTPEQMKAVSGDAEQAGLCDTSNGVIYILAGGATHPIVIHELCHAHMAQSLVHSADLTSKQIEEIMCDIFAFNWFRIVLLARVVVHNLTCYEQYIQTGEKQDWVDCPVDVLTNSLFEDLQELIATYTTGSTANPILKSAIAKKKRTRRFKNSSKR